MPSEPSDQHLSLSDLESAQTTTEFIPRGPRGPILRPFRGAQFKLRTPEAMLSFLNGGLQIKADCGLGRIAD
eukprot:4496809-Alexandrium_andersonii.AAC.1